MRMLKFSLILLIVSVSAILNTFAAKSVNNFAIANQNLRDNKLFVPNTFISTPFSFFLSLIRGVSEGQWENGSCTATVVLIEGSTITEISVPINFTSNDFVVNGLNLPLGYKSNLAASLPANKTSGYIKIRLQYYDPSSQTTITNYSADSYELLPPPPNPYPGSIIIENWVSNTLDHHYLAKAGDSPSPWSSYFYESNAFRAFSNQVTGTIPIYKFKGSYPDNTYSFLYSTGINQNQFWVSQGIAFYAFATQVPGSQPIRCYTNAQSKNHYFSIYQETDPYWHLQYIAFYAFPVN